MTTILATRPFRKNNDSNNSTNQLSHHNIHCVLPKKVICFLCNLKDIIFSWTSIIIWEQLFTENYQVYQHSIYNFNNTDNLEKHIQDNHVKKIPDVMKPKMKWI